MASNDIRKKFRATTSAHTHMSRSVLGILSMDAAAAVYATAKRHLLHAATNEIQRRQASLARIETTHTKNYLCQREMRKKTFRKISKL